MKPEYLEELCNKHKNDKNYQHRDLPWDQFDALAVKSVQRLPAEEQEMLAKVGKQYDMNTALRVARYRFMAQTNLFFLCKLLEKYRDTSDRYYFWTDGQVHNTH